MVRVAVRVRATVRSVRFRVRVRVRISAGRWAESMVGQFGRSSADRLIRPTSRISRPNQPTGRPTD